MSVVSSEEVFGYLSIAAPTAAEETLMSTLIPLAESALKSYAGFSIEQATYTHFLPEHDQWHDRDVTQLDVANNRVILDYAGDSRTLFLPERPVRSITSVNEDMAAYGGQGSGDFSGSNLTAGTDYYIDYTTSGVSWSGSLVRITGAWSTRQRTVKVVYVAGMTAAELTNGTVRGPEGSNVRQLKMAALIACAGAFAQAKRFQPGATGSIGPVVSERLADYSVTYSENYVKQFAMVSDLPDQSKRLVDPFRRLTL